MLERTERVRKSVVMDEDELPFTPERVLDETWRTEVYEPKMKIFYDQVVRFNHNVYFAERLLKFPARILGIPAEKTIFLRYILDNAFREAILGICRLTLDEKTYNDSEPYTLLRFYKELKNHLKGPYHENAGTEEKRQLFVYFQQGQFPKQDVLTKKIRNLRNWYFAHLDKVHMTESTEDVQITVKEMNEIRDNLNKRFETLSFNALGSNLFLFPDYAPVIFLSRSSSVM